MQDIMLSVLMATYNHEHYIEQAIRSVLMQKVSFQYEVVIADDCSQDGTQEVLRRLEPSLPDNFHIIYRTANMGGNGKNNFKDMYSRAVGKYIIVLEGDDYWTYDQKLQKEVDFLESHSDYSAVAHNTFVVDHNGDVRTDYEYPECKREEYTFREYEKGILAGQTTTIMYRNIVHSSGFLNITNLPVKYPGDRRTNFLLLCNGRVRCIQEKWSAYRYVPEFGTSYTARVSRLSDDAELRMEVDYHRALLTYARHEFPNNNAAIESVEARYMWFFLRDIRRKDHQDTTWRNWFKEFYNLRSKTHTLAYIAKGIFYHASTQVLRLLSKN